MKRTLNALTTVISLATGTVCAASPVDADLVILPAPPNAWHTTVGHWEKQLELSDEGVVVPPPSAEYARASHLGASTRSAGGLRQSVLLDWKDLWQSWLRIESVQPVDLRPYMGGSLEFDIDVADLSGGSASVAEMTRGSVKVKLSCGNGCERAVSLFGPMRDWTGKGWQHVALPMSCFVREGADFSQVKAPFALEAGGTGRVSVANVRITRKPRPGMACPDYRTESVTPAMLDESWSVDWWLPRHEQKLREKRELIAAGTPPQLVFIGDSITQGWEKEGREVWQQHFAQYHALALGFGGDRTENALWRLQHGEIDGIAPKAVVLMIGTNNTGHRGEDPKTTAAGIKRLLDEIRRRLPRTQVLLLAIFPRGEKADDFLRGLNQRVNRIIAGHADGRSVHFLDIGPALLGADGTLSKDVMPDLLHPNAKGYAIWQRAMDPALQRLMARP
jgi:lysophospholipase L1-like esterase